RLAVPCGRCSRFWIRRIGRCAASQEFCGSLWGRPIDRPGNAGNYALAERKRVCRAGRAVDDCRCAGACRLLLVGLHPAQEIHDVILDSHDARLYRLVYRGVRCFLAPVRHTMIVKLKLSALRETHWYEYLIRFGLGGAMTVAAGLIARRFGPIVGGLF